MLPTTLRGEPVFLLPYLANWAAQQPALTLEVDAAITRSLGGVEARESLAHTLRATAFTCSLFLRPAENAAFRAALRQLGSTRVLMPLWPLAHRLLDGRIVYTDGEGRILTAPDGAIYTTGAVVYALPAPLHTGLWLTFGMRNADFGLPNEETPADDDTTRFIADADTLYAIHEDPDASPWAHSAFRNPHSAFRVPLMLGVFKKLPDPVALTPGLLTVGIEFMDTAPAIFAPRSADETPAPATPQGELFPFTPNWAGEVRAGGVSYEIDREHIGHGRTPATTYYPQPHARVLQAQFNTFTHAALARLVAFFHRRRGPVETFAVEHPQDGPLTVRFAKKTLDLTFADGRIAALRLDFLETPPADPAALPERAQLFRFTYGLGTQKVVYRCTGYERDLVAGGELYLAQKIEHGDITESLEPERTKVKLTARAWEGNPLMLLHPPRLEGPIQVEILRCDLDAAGAPAALQLRFIGRVGRPDFDGPKITCEAAHLLADLQNNVPDLLVQAECNHEFCSPACGVALAAWTFTGAVLAYDGAALTLGNIARPGAPLPALSAGAFARGRVEFGDGAGFQSRGIIASTALAAGALTLALSQPFDQAPAGTVKFFPACEGTQAACEYFQNHPRFGGFPFVPAGNPALKPIKKETSQGKK
jgi:hypothetical protein